MTSKAKASLTSYNFDQLKKLYQENPEQFDELADQALKQACQGSTPEKSLKLQQLQWTIDMQLRKAKTPLGRMHVMENIFYGQVYGEKGNLAKLVSGWNDLLQAINGSEIAPAKKKELQLKSR